VGFSAWLRSNSEHFLLEAAQRDMARRHGRPVGAPERRGVMAFLWRWIFVPIYRVLPWRLRRAIMHTMPGSHRRRWGGRAPPRGSREVMDRGSAA
jgi:hypothetical protein